MDMKYLRLLAKEYPTIESAASEIINLSAIRSLIRSLSAYAEKRIGHDKNKDRPCSRQDRIGCRP